jgi:2-polyprenyl-6-methoxyphenol hydroxylase-like FAD-dependent oxidoreductase
MQADVLVVGGGPAGLATSIAASLKGFRVALIDPRKPPIDKPCGEGLLPEAVSALQRLGIEIDSRIAVPIAGIRFSDENSQATASLSAGKAFGLRRTVLHQLLVERAAQVGVTLLWGAPISSLGSRHLCLDGQRISYRWLVGADGLHSRVRKFAGLESSHRPHSRFGFRRHYLIAPWSNFVEVRWGAKSQMIVTPTGPGEICISRFSSDPRVRIDDSIDQFSDVAARLRGVLPASNQAGSLTTLGRARSAVRGNIALVGDASCTVDGIAGQGLSLAFQQALCLAEAVGRDDLSQYESAHRRITRAAMRMTRLLLWMNASAALRRKVLRLFDTRPAIFSKMILVHAGQCAPDMLGTYEMLNLGWRVLWA